MNDIPNTTSPLVSIGVPVFNGFPLLRHALDSLLAQDYGNYEIIISDNASTDNTQLICQQYAGRDSRIKYFRNEKNIGAPNNFKRVLELSEGKFFMWAAHDDTWSPNYVSTLVDKLCEFPESILACGQGVFMNPPKWRIEPAPPERPIGKAEMADLHIDIYAITWVYGLYDRFKLQKIVHKLVNAWSPRGADVAFVMHICLNYKVVGSNSAQYYRYVGGSESQFAPTTPLQGIIWITWLAIKFLQEIFGSGVHWKRKKKIGQVVLSMWRVEVLGNLLGLLRQTLRTVPKWIIKKMGYDIARNKQVPPKIDAHQITQTILKKSPDGPIRIHIGCGTRILKGWININKQYIRDFTHHTYAGKDYPVHVRGDITDFLPLDVSQDPIPLPDNSVDVIFHEDFIGHLNSHQVIYFLKETLRVLKPGSIHRVSTQNLIPTLNKSSDYSRGFEGIDPYLWERSNYQMVLTPRILEELALTIGYSKVSFTNKNESSSSLIPLECWPGDDQSDDDNIFADLIK
jgi:glycosyltransferase involved in cell wall biosynthesis